MRTLLSNMTLIDGTGAAPAGDAWLLVDGGRIAEIGRGAAPPADARVDGVAAGGDGVVDLGGKTCVPGLIDLHVHLCWDGSADPADVNRREGEELTLLRMARHARDPSSAASPPCATWAPSLTSPWSSTAPSATGSCPGRG